MARAEVGMGWGDPGTLHRECPGRSAEVGIGWGQSLGSLCRGYLGKIAEVGTTQVVPGFSIHRAPWQVSWSHGEAQTSKACGTHHRATPGLGELKRRWGTNWRVLGHSIQEEPWEYS